MADKISGLFILILLLASCSSKLQKPDPIRFPAYTKNICIDSAIFQAGPCEPSIVIDPSDINHIVAGSILNRFYESLDGGYTWDVSYIESSYGVYGDPVLRMDGSGNTYYAHLSNPTGKAYQDDAFLDRIVVQKYDKNKWTDGSYPPCNHLKDHDKQWLDISHETGDIVMTWTEFDKYGSPDPEDKSRILFSASSDQSKTWTTAVPISQYEGNCEDDDQTTEGAVPVIDDKGNVYVVWGYDEKLWFDRSSDGGKTWLENDKIISVQPGGWSYDIPGIARCNGMPVLEMDKSNGPYEGQLYVNWSDQRNGKDDTDIWIISSSDQGETWTDPVRVNDDSPGKHQFFSWMDVDPVTGYVYIVFYDRRNHLGNETDVYLAYSVDGGKSFENKLISESPFTPNTSVFFGDYNDISAFNNVVRPIWTRQEGIKLSVLTAIINLQAKS